MSTTIFWRRISMNREIKLAAAGAGVKLWQVADALNMADSSLSRKLRRELPQTEKERIYKAIEELKTGKGGHHATNANG
jgi:hypothetical protein